MLCSFFFNRTLYSLYCWEMVLDKVVDFLFTPFRLLLSKAIYKLNLFGSVKRHYHSYEEFEEDKKRGYEDLTCNLDYGTCSYRSKGTLSASLMPYFMLIISINKYMRVLPMPDMPFEAWLLITATLSSSIINFFCLRKDRFKTYFKKFKNKKNILKWHLVCLFYIIGTCISTYYAIMFFNAERFGFKPF